MRPTAGSTTCTRARRGPRRTGRLITRGEGSHTAPPATKEHQTRLQCERVLCLNGRASGLREFAMRVPILLAFAGLSATLVFAQQPQVNTPTGANTPTATEIPRAQTTPSQDPTPATTQTQTTAQTPAPAQQTPAASQPSASTSTPGTTPPDTTTAAQASTKDQTADSKNQTA